MPPALVTARGRTTDDPVLVTGAGGFVGGHVVSALAEAGYRVRALTRGTPPSLPSGGSIEWIRGDLRHEADRARAVAGARGVVHSAGWVSLGSDPRGESRSINVDATRALLDRAEAAGVERFVYTSTLWTVAAGTATEPADEDAAWNLHGLDSPYSRTKREAERLVLGRDRPGFGTLILNPALVIGPRDVRPTSTRVFLHMARTPVAFLPRGGTPVIDARVAAQAHVRALERGETGQRYVLAGPYLSYHQLASIVARLAGKPWCVVTIPDAAQGPLSWMADRLDRLAGGRWAEVSSAAVVGGFLRLHASGARADAAFGLEHRPPIQSIFDALDDHRRSGRAPWLSPRRPTPDDITATDLSVY